MKLPKEKGNEETRCCGVQDGQIKATLIRKVLQCVFIQVCMCSGFEATASPHGISQRETSSTPAVWAKSRTKRLSLLMVIFVCNKQHSKHIFVYVI